ncbi:beta-N-acetylglucosaminidase domain-containing protein [Marinimicrobium agarilyticum]|uniref:beta-N-acetylglucosaminidase domain-containing protein n=1 Tax=Marinimicrobium agarilyticum TaxID=306546 RepID=UPI000410B253|nr:beta-N-acetylglucosaminidase domain-containing protein [Marinimicrobium agarilyticum]
MPRRSSQEGSSPPLGVIEGFFGRPWSWAARIDAIDFMAQAGYDFYLYAPKADAHLRRQWTHDWPAADWRHLQKLRQHSRERGIRFGIGLSPMELYREPSAESRAALTTKIQRLNQLEPDILCLLFDDMRGDLPELAARQIELAHSAAEASTASSLILCPTYYSPDPILEKVFGTRPERYWQDLGDGLDPAIDLFWTGPDVCSREYPLEHLNQVTDWLGRRPFLWDNYPVNDSARLCDFLRLSPYPESHGRLTGSVAGHAVNPMNQPYLSRLPLATLPMAYAEGAGYDPTEAFELALRRWCPEELGERLREDLPLIEERGLAAMSDADKAALKSHYESLAVQSPGTSGAHQARELLDWLDHRYAFDPACLTD